jgi:hypothetical protein
VIKVVKHRYAICCVHFRYMYISIIHIFVAAIFHARTARIPVNSYRVISASSTGSETTIVCLYDRCHK